MQRIKAQVINKCVCKGKIVAEPTARRAATQHHLPRTFFLRFPFSRDPPTSSRGDYLDTKIRPPYEIE